MLKKKKVIFLQRERENTITFPYKKINEECHQKGEDWNECPSHKTYMTNFFPLPWAQWSDEA